MVKQRPTPDLINRAAEALARPRASGAPGALRRRGLD